MRLGAALAGLAVLGSLVVAPTPAHAYCCLTVKYAVVDTDNCARLEGTLPVTRVTGGCMLYDSADDTFFETDAGGKAVKIEMYDSSGMVAKVEFHPNGEKLWVYDTRNDGDTVYVYLDYANGATYGPFSAKGTDDVIDHEVFDFDWTEGNWYGVDVNDSASVYDNIAYARGVA